MRPAGINSALCLAAIVAFVAVPAPADAQEPRSERQARPAPLAVQQVASPSQLELTARRAQLRMAGGFIKIDGVDGESSARRAGAYIKIDGVEGESTKARSAGGGQIDVLAWSWGSSRHGARGGGGGGRIALASLDQVTVTKGVDKSSPKLAEKLTRGQQLGTIVLEARSRDGSEDGYVRYTLTDAVVASVESSSGRGEGSPSETLSISFTKIEVDYQGQELGGLLGVPVQERGTR